MNVRSRTCFRAEAMTEGLAKIVSKRICRTGGRRLLHILGEGPGQRSREARDMGDYGPTVGNPRRPGAITPFSISHMGR